MSKEEQPVDQGGVQHALVELARLEEEFEKVDVDILRETIKRQEPLFARRNTITSKITNFWPLIFEQAAAALSFDEYITPEDSYLLEKSLCGINVTRPDAATEPRTVQIEFVFSENEYFSDSVLQKKFVYQPGAGGLASVPVAIGWKGGKDLTEGVTKAAVEAFEERENRKGRGRGEKEVRLAKLMERGPSSFFNWFLWSGSHQAFGEVHEHGDCDHDHEEDGPVEVFPDGDDLAVQIAEDVYPNAPKYFAEALEESGSDDDDDDDDDEEELTKNSASALLTQMGKVKRNDAANDESEDDEPAKKKLRK